MTSLLKGKWEVFPSKSEILYHGAYRSGIFDYRDIILSPFNLSLADQRAESHLNRVGILEMRARWTASSGRLSNSSTALRICVEKSLEEYTKISIERLFISQRIIAQRDWWWKMTTVTQQFITRIITSVYFAHWLGSHELSRNISPLAIN